MDNIIPTACYNFYDRKGRRLAAYCRFLDHEKAEIFILTCSHEDQFSKKKARKVYGEFIKSGYLPLDKSVAKIIIDENIYNPSIYIVDIAVEQRELQTLLKYLANHHYVYTPATIDVEVLVKGTEMYNHINLTLC